MFATSSAVKAIARREINRNASAVSVRAMANLAAFDDFGKNVFTGAVADEYLKKHGASLSMLKDPAWVQNSPDVVADAVFDWYVQHIMSRNKTERISFCRRVVAKATVSVFFLFRSPLFYVNIFTGLLTVVSMCTAIGSSLWPPVVFVTV